jgi:hypothetical protein
MSVDMAPVSASGNGLPIADFFWLFFCQVSSAPSHSRGRLTNQGEANHFGGYADIRGLSHFFSSPRPCFLTVSDRALKSLLTLISERPSCAGLRVDQPASEVIGYLSCFCSLSRSYLGRHCPAPNCAFMIQRQLSNARPCGYSLGLYAELPTTFVACRYLRTL